MAAKVEKKNIVDVCEIRRWDEKFIGLPEEMSFKEGIKVLYKQDQYEEQLVDVSEKVVGFPWDVARAFAKALKTSFGFADAASTKGGFLGMMDVPPKLINVEVRHGVTEEVPWGAFELPNTDGAKVTMDVANTESGDLAVSFSSEMKRKYSNILKELCSLTRQILAEESIYKGQALRVQFKDENGDLRVIPKVSFIPPAMLNEDILIFNRSLEKVIEDHVYSPLRWPKEAKMLGRDFRRGILLTGKHGTGKTLLTCRIAREAEKNNITTVYIDDISELPEALRFAQTYAPAVVIGEDIDRAVNLQRDGLTNRIMNTLDGLDTKEHEIMVVVTTNNPEMLHEGFLRAGRIDHRIFVDPPDVDAIERLLWAYGGMLIEEGEDLSEVATVLWESSIKPCHVKNVLDRAKDSLLNRVMKAGGNIKTAKLVAEDLLTAAHSFQNEEDGLKNVKVVEERPSFKLHEMELRPIVEGNGQTKGQRVSL